MAYNGDATNSKCYNAVETMIINIDTTTDIGKKLYIPAYWAEFQVIAQDFIAVSAATSLLGAVGAVSAVGAVGASVGSTVGLDVAQYATI